MNQKEIYIYERANFIKRLENSSKFEQLKFLNQVQYPIGSYGANYKERNQLVIKAGILLKKHSVQETFNKLIKIQ